MFCYLKRKFTPKHQANAITLKIVLGVSLGLCLGYILLIFDDIIWSSRNVMYLFYVGELYIYLLQIVGLPLIMSSIVYAVSTLKLKCLGRAGTKAIIYYGLNAVYAVIIGLVAVMIVSPGGGTTNVFSFGGHLKCFNVFDILIEFVSKAFPTNVMDATMYRYHRTATENSTEGAEGVCEFIDVPNDGTNIVGLIMFATSLGVSLRKLKARSLPIVRFCGTLQSASILLTEWLFWPISAGVLSSVAAHVVEVRGEITLILIRILLYIATCMLGLVLYILSACCVYMYVIRKNPFEFMKSLKRAVGTSFETASGCTSSQLLETCLENDLKFGPLLVKPLLAIAAATDVACKSLVKVIAAIFIAQIHGVPVNIGDLLIITVASVGTGVGHFGKSHFGPGLVATVMVVDAVELPLISITYILAVDWIIDRISTTATLMTHGIGTAILCELNHNFTQNHQDEISVPAVSDIVTTYM